MNPSHTTWLINSNLNGRGLTSYTHAFWWCLEKTLQHLQWERKTGRLRQSRECESKKCQSEFMHCQSLVAPEWQPGDEEEKFGSFTTGSQRWLNYFWGFSEQEILSYKVSHNRNSLAKQDHVVPHQICTQKSTNMSRTSFYFCLEGMFETEKAVPKKSLCSKSE